MTLRLFDTASRAVREFRPVKQGKASVYLCGATVQGTPHLGHLRSAVCFDILVRWLEVSGHQVTYCRNVTDIDDKILQAAESEDVPWWALAERNLREFTAAYELLGCRAPDAEPRATGHVPDIIRLIQRLLTSGHAYASGRDVYFDVDSDPHYGTLSRRPAAGQAPASPGAAGTAGTAGAVGASGLLEALGASDLSRAVGANGAAGAAGAVGVDGAGERPAQKRSPQDFVLWKGAKPGEPAWRAPWGSGRPAWHIECSAMAAGYLGSVFDIHGGGQDLAFPHHENERAQSQAAGDEFARYWVHHGLVTTVGQEPGKSAGDVVTVADALCLVRPQELRYYLAQAHYRSTIEYSAEALEDAAAAYRRVERFITRAGHALGWAAPPPELPFSFAAALDDDLSVPSALAALHATVRDGNYALSTGDRENAAACLAQAQAMLEVLGLDPLDPAWRTSDSGGRLRGVVDALVALALRQREAARARGDYASADSIRDVLEDSGMMVEDTPEGTRWELAR